jgi:hypothetical protein
MESVNPEIIYTQPTFCGESPVMDTNSLFKDFTLTILQEDWRQDEFLPKNQVSFAEEEIGKIENISSNYSKKQNATTSFTKIHIRNFPQESYLNIDFTELTMLLDVIQIGNLKLKQHEGFVKNAFVVKSDYAIYYGIVEDQQVKRLCINNFSTDSLTEIVKVAKAFDLIFLNWTNGKLYGKQ